MLFVATGMLAFAQSGQMQNVSRSSIPKPPETVKQPITETIHGVTLTDPYRWLEDQNSPQTRAWIEAQNAYAQPLLHAYAGRDRLQKQIEAAYRIDSISRPSVRGDREFFLRRHPDQNLDVIYVREKGKDRVLVDPNAMSPDGSISATIEGISDKGDVLAYGLRKGGADETTVHFMDVDTGKDLADSFPLARYGSLQITPDLKAVYYTKYIPKVGPRAFLHQMGDDPASDQQIFGDKYGTGEYISLQLAHDASYIIYSVFHGSAAEKVEVYYQDLRGEKPLVPIVTDIAAPFNVELAGDHILMETNWQAPNGRVLNVDLNDPARDKWKVVVPESKFPIDDFTAAGGKILVTYLEDVISHVKVYNTSGRLEGEVKLPGIGTASVGGRWEQPDAYYSFTSFSTPRDIYRYNVPSGKQELWAQEKVPIDTAQFVTKQVWYQSKDKTRVPMFIVYKKGTKLDGNNPTLLTGYGGFRLSRTAEFNTEAAVWVENGGVFALPNLRGGFEFGEAWHKAGMLANKQNVFDDFISAAEYLIANKYTNPKKLAIRGASNGGLLTGAALTQRPDLFGAVVIAYPLLDMLRYQDFLVARFWVPEYGSSEDPEQFKYLLKYSPYQNVKPGTKYPAVMLTTGDSDTRVAPLHARKMTAELQADTGSDKPIILHYDTRAGHSRGGVAIDRQIEDLTDELSFIMWQLQVPPQGEQAKSAKAGKYYRCN
jgi:prolyl oligopeptidase